MTKVPGTLGEVIEGPSVNHPIDRGDDGEPAQCDMGDEDVESVKGRRKELRYGIEREIPRGVRGIETRRVRAHVASKDGGETPVRQEVAPDSSPERTRTRARGLTHRRTAPTARGPTVVGLMAPGPLARGPIVAGLVAQGPMTRGPRWSDCWREGL